MDGNTNNGTSSYGEEIDNIRNSRIREDEFIKMIETALHLKIEEVPSLASFIERESGYIEDGSIILNARIPNKNIKLEGTRYYYSKGRKVIHFTSVSALFSIINDGALRLYNLHNSNDSCEYSFASNQLREIYSLQGFDEKKIEGYIEKMKEYSFIFSTASTDEIKNKILWDKYGQKGRGVAIEFEILNELNDWENFYFSNVFYNELEEFEDLKEKWKRIQLDNKQINYQIKLNQLLSLHKSKYNCSDEKENWSDEKEIRLLTLLPEDIHFIPYNERIFTDFKLNKSDKVIRYFKLPLCDDSGKFIEMELNSRPEYFWGKIPRLRISNIYFSVEFPIRNDGFTKFQVDLQKYISDKMYYWVGSLPNKKIEYEITSTNFNSFF